MRIIPPLIQAGWEGKVQLLPLILYALILVLLWILLGRRITRKRFKILVSVSLGVSIILFAFVGPFRYQWFLPSSRRLISHKLLPQAKEATRKGLASAKRENWTEAIRYFNRARATAPVSSKALFNLALAYDQAGQKELLAIAWYKAYLAAYPNAPNRDNVLARIKTINLIASKRADLLRQSAEQAAEVMEAWEENKNGYKIDRATKTNIFINLAWANAHFFDAKRAIFWTESLESNKVTPDVRKKIQLRAESSTAARRILDEPEDYGKRYGVAIAYRVIKDETWADTATQAETQAERSDNKAAMETASLIKDIPDRMVAFRRVADVQLRARNFSGCNQTLQKALDTVTLITTAWIRDDAYSWISEWQARCGNVPAARETLKLVQNPKVKRLVYGTVADAQAKSGNGLGALVTLQQGKARLKSYKEIAGIINNKRAVEVFDWMAFAQEIESSLESFRYPDEWMDSLRRESTRPHILASTLSSEAKKYAYFIREFWEKGRDRREFQYRRFFFSKEFFPKEILLLLIALMTPFILLSVLGIIIQLIRRKRVTFWFGPPLIILGLNIFIFWNWSIVYFLYGYSFAYCEPKSAVAWFTLIFLILSTAGVMLCRRGFGLMRKKAKVSLESG